MELKFCKFTTYEESRGNFTAIYNYVTLNDIEQYHGKEFKDQFYKFISEKIVPSLFGKVEGYFFIDYQFYAYRTKLYLET